MSLSASSPNQTSLSCQDGNGDQCTTIWLSTIVSTCALEANQTCYEANRAGDSSDEASGLMWGIFLSLVGDVIISVGLALQKVAHNIIKNTKSKDLGGKPPAYTNIKTWWAGILLTIAGEVRSRHHALGVSIFSQQMVL